MTTDEIINLKIPCFSCTYGHNCRYYSNVLWDQWLFENPNAGCPAMKYTYDSIYYAAIKALEEKKRMESQRTTIWDDYPRAR